MSPSRTSRDWQVIRRQKGTGDEMASKKRTRICLCPIPSLVSPQRSDPGPVNFLPGACVSVGGAGRACAWRRPYRLRRDFWEPRETIRPVSTARRRPPARDAWETALGSGSQADRDELTSTTDPIAGGRPSLGGLAAWAFSPLGAAFPGHQKSARDAAPPPEPPKTLASGRGTAPESTRLVSPGRSGERSSGSIRSILGGRERERERGSGGRIGELTNSR